jgi:hypothetical protein
VGWLFVGCGFGFAVGRGAGSGFFVECDVTWFEDVPPEECRDPVDPFEPAGVVATTMAAARVASDERYAAEYGVEEAGRELAGTVAAAPGVEPAAGTGPGSGISDGTGERRGAAAASVACLPVLKMTVESGAVVPNASTTHAEQPTTPSATKIGRRLGEGRWALMPSPACSNRE